jgi:hypothetical protein
MKMYKFHLKWFRPNRYYTPRSINLQLHSASCKNELLYEQNVFTTVPVYRNGVDTNTVIIWGPHFTDFIPHIWLFLSRVTAFLPSQCTLINSLLKYCVQYSIYKRDLKRRYSSSVLCHICTPSHPKKMGWKECHCSPDTPDIHPLLPYPWYNEILTWESSHTAPLLPRVFMKNFYQVILFNLDFNP